MLKDKEFTVTEIPSAIEIDCESFISLYGNDLTKSKLKPYRHSFRNSFDKYLDNSIIPEALLNKVSEITQLPISHQEPWKIVRYREGEKFDPHFDGLLRKFSILFYLRSADVGGQTVFPNANIFVQPEPRKLVIWKNDEYYSLHGSYMVTKGEKWLLNTWVHEKSTKE